uniref:DUF3558 domain-containing protein n=1 Tax=Streptomyces sp. NBC_00049 TaxID=2903617 RepID=A0AAU2JSN9_9ACTN
MITEPELDGEWADAGPPEVAEAAASRERVPGRGRPWLWALGGAVLASALWAGTLAVQDRFPGVGAAPPLAYRHSEDLCKEAPLAALSKATVPYRETTTKSVGGPVVDWAHCFFSVDRSGEDRVYMAQVMVELHKKADPQAEFGAGPVLTSALPEQAVDVQELPGLGERALLGGGLGGTGLRLQVLDGGAVFTLAVEWWSEDGDPEPDTDAIKGAMAEDMRTLMAALRAK